MRLLLICFLIVSLYANHLSNETSPYLKQHKNDLIDWYPWGEQPLKKAKKQNKLILLSIGYSTCHWCHEMAKESYNDKKIAEILNKFYICIKIDKEEYPHIDEYYQKIYEIINKKSGGWPLTLILTSDLKPVMAKTYIPKNSSKNYKGFLELLQEYANMPKDKLNKYGENILKLLDSKKSIKNNLKKEEFIKSFLKIYDDKYKGFYKKRKYPNVSILDVLLDLYLLDNDMLAKKMVFESLDTMANSGLYDQIEGGFFRFSVDRKWQMPHFEKMLYSNAQLLNIYIRGYTYTKKRLYKKIIKETISHIDSYFKINKLYKSASDADSINFENKEEEGFYFIFSYEKVYKYLLKKGFDKQTIKKNLDYLCITKDGNVDFEYSHPHITAPKKPKNFKKIKKALQDYRKLKKYPFVDDKINLAWNSLYLDAKLKAGIIDENYKKEALESIDELIYTFYLKNELYHQKIASSIPKQKGLLEDYAFFAKLLFDAYEATFDKRYLYLFESIVKDSIHLFYKNDIWYLSNDGLYIKADISKSEYKNPLAQNLINIYILALLEANHQYYSIANKSLKQFENKLLKTPQKYPSMLKVYLLNKYKPVLIKSTVKNLKNIKLCYPYAYKKSIDNSYYSACSIDRCFIYEKNKKVFLNSLKKILKNDVSVTYPLCSK
jgi:uncharacterized protein YyaL (SSP411 family)